MTPHFNIQQHSEDWFKIKWGKIGGTRAHGLLVDSETLLVELLAEHCEEFSIGESFQSDDMIRGNHLEAEAREVLSQYIGIDLIECGWWQSDENPLLGISPDGTNENCTISAEIKCPARKKHTQTILANEIPRDNIRQAVHYFTVNPKLEKHFFCSYRPENKYKQLFVKELTLDTLVDVGLTEKTTETRKDPKGNDKEYVVTVPMMRTIREWVELNRSKANEIKQDLEKNIEKIYF